MLCLVVVFGVHSLVDWTWYVPGNACVALLCAGWLAGRGPLEATAAVEAQAIRRGALPPARGCRVQRVRAVHGRGRATVIAGAGPCANAAA